MTLQPTSLGTTYLDDLVEQISLPPSIGDRAKEHYEAVGNWMEDDGSSLAPYKPLIYPQGSIALGTAIRPLKGDEHDVDAVCLLERPPAPIFQQQLKQMTGDRLRENSNYRRMLDPPTGGRRCWTLKYREIPAFHLDILPAVPDDPAYLASRGVPYDWAKTAIQITDTTTWRTSAPWPKSNPLGFRAWFRSRMSQRLQRAKVTLAHSLPAISSLSTVEMMEKIPDYQVRTPLQAAVQVLKYHRDLVVGDDADKPISIIITTLAGHAYQNEDSVAGAVLGIVPRMRDYIHASNTYGNYTIVNPVDPRENFADKWNEQPRKAQVFLHWLNAVEQLVDRLATSRSVDELQNSVTEGLNHEHAQKAMMETRKASSGGQSAVSTAFGTVLVPRRNDVAAYPSVERPSTPPWNSR